MTEIKYNEVTNCLCYNNDEKILKWQLLFPPKLYNSKFYHNNNINLNTTMPSNITSFSNPKRKCRKYRNALRYKTQPITFDEIIEADEEVITEFNNNTNNNNDNQNSNDSSTNKDKNNNEVKSLYPIFPNTCAISAKAKSNWNGFQPNEDDDEVFDKTLTKDQATEELSKLEMEKAWHRRRSLRLMRNSLVEEAEVEGC